jgi:hypothetical protein
MIYTVKSFSGIKKENKTREFFNHSFEEKTVDIYRVFGPVAPPEKTFLGGVDQIKSSWHNRVRNHARQQAIVCVCDTDWASV